MHRIAVVTGSSSGIGRATATRLLEAGFTVIGLARHHNQSDINHDRYHPCTADVSDIKKLDKIAADISKDNPKISASGTLNIEGILQDVPDYARYSFYNGREMWVNDYHGIEKYDKEQMKTD